MENYRVLLVDDEEELVETLVERLDYRGFSSKYAVNGQTALQMLQQHKFDIVVIDLKLPGMSGEELLRTIRTAYSHLPVLMMTGHGSSTQGEHEKPEGVYDFLLKPVKISELVTKIQEAIKAYELKQE